MKHALAEFILNWNKSHTRFTFSANSEPVTERPTGVAVRYSAAKYQNHLSIAQWDRLKGIVEVKSHGTMYVVSSEELFRRGIIDIAVASSNHNYQERLVVGVLKWIGEDFFPKEDEDE